MPGEIRIDPAIQALADEVSKFPGMQNRGIADRMQSMRAVEHVLHMSGDSGSEAIVRVEPVVDSSQAVRPTQTIEGEI
jgi:hypothetical protein